MMGSLFAQAAYTLFQQSAIDPAFILMFVLALAKIQKLRFLTPDHEEGCHRKSIFGDDDSGLSAIGPVRNCRLILKSSGLCRRMPSFFWWTTTFNGGIKLSLAD
jgi:hypothetical protein